MKKPPEQVCKMPENDQGIEAISQNLKGLQDLFVRRLSEDKNTKQLIRSLEQSLRERDDLDTHKAFAPLFKELLLAVDRLQSNDPSLELNRSVAEEILDLLSQYGLNPINTNGSVDPRVHEVVGIASDGKSKDQTAAEPGSICKVIRPGYLMGNMVLRPAQVVIQSRLDDSTQTGNERN